MTIRNYSHKVILVELPPEPGVRRELDKVMELIQDRTDSDVLVDFAEVDILVSLSLSGLIQLHKLINAAGRRLIFFNVSSLTRGIFKVTCFDNIFEFADDLSAANAVLSTPSAPQPVD